MECGYCTNEINLNFFNLYKEDFLLCKNCLSNLELLLFKDNILEVIFYNNDYLDDFLKEYNKGDYSLVILFANIIEFYINNYIDCEKIYFYDCEFLENEMSLNSSGNYKYIFVIFLDEDIINDIFLKYNFDFKILCLFASKKLINKRKKLLKML